MRKNGNYYSPGFFYLSLDTKDLIDNVIGTPHEATFVHEYIHLLQDISLYSSRCYLRQMVNHFRGIVDTIRISTQKQTRPISPSSKNLIINKKIFDTLWGNGHTLGKAWTIKRMVVVPD